MQLTARGQTSTHLLRLSWDGHPLYRSAEFGWVYRVSGRRAILQADPQAKSALAFEQGRLALAQIRRGESAGEFKEKGGKSRVALNPDIALYEQTFIRDVIFLKIPHPEGDAHRVGKILSKGLSKHLENETLTSEYVLAKQAIDMDMSCSYWISVRDRVKEQMVVKRADELDMGLPAELGNDLDFGMILPQVVVMGAITRRAVEKTWLVRFRLFAVSSAFLSLTDTSLLLDGLQPEIGQSGIRVESYGPSSSWLFDRGRRRRLGRTLDRQSAGRCSVGDPRGNTDRLDDFGRYQG